jgi:hypothetical protein
VRQKDGEEESFQFPKLKKDFFSRHQKTARAELTHIGHLMSEIATEMAYKLKAQGSELFFFEEGARAG